MRTRKLLIAILIAALGVFALAGSASAAVTHPREPKGEAEEECIQKLEGGGSIDDCQKAPSPIKPANNELIWGAISFVVLLFLMWKFAYPGIKKGMQDSFRPHPQERRGRRQRQGASRDRARAVPRAARRREERVGPHRRGGAAAGRRARSASVRQRCRPSSPSMRERAAADIEASKAQAVADLRAEVARLAIGAAEVVVQHNLDATPRPSSSRTTSARSGRTREHAGPHRRLRHRPLRGRAGGGLPRRGRGRAVPLRPHARGQRRAAQRARRRSHPGRAPRGHRRGAVGRQGVERHDLTGQLRGRGWPGS